MGPTSSDWCRAKNCSCGCEVYSSLHTLRRLSGSRGQEDKVNKTLPSDQENLDSLKPTSFKTEWILGEALSKKATTVLPLNATLLLFSRRKPSYPLKSLSSQTNSSKQSLPETSSDPIKRRSERQRQRRLLQQPRVISDRGREKVDDIQGLLWDRQHGRKGAKVKSGVAAQHERNHKLGSVCGGHASQFLRRRDLT